MFKSKKQEPKINSKVKRSVACTYCTFKLSDLCVQGGQLRAVAGPGSARIGGPTPRHNILYEKLKNFQTTLTVVRIIEKVFFSLRSCGSQPVEGQPGGRAAGRSVTH